MLTIKFHSSFKKDYKRVIKRGYNVKLMEDVINKLAKQEQLPEKNMENIISEENLIFSEWWCINE